MTARTIDEMDCDGKLLLCACFEFITFLGYPANYVGRSNPDANMHKVEGVMTEAQWQAAPACNTVRGDTVLFVVLLVLFVLFSCWIDFCLQIDRTYSAQYPRTRVYSGDFLTIAYTPNGHVSWMAPPPPNGCKSMYYHIFPKVSSQLTLLPGALRAHLLLS